MVRRRIELFTGNAYFTPELPLFVNRSVESFGLHEHSHDFLEISYVSEGNGSHMINDAALPVAQGDIFQVPVGTSHVFRPASASGKQPLIVYNCIFAVHAFMEITRSFPGGEVLLPLLSGNQFLHYKDTTGEFRRLFQQLHHEFISSRSGRVAALHAGVFQLLLFLHRLNAPADRDVQDSARLESVLNELHRSFQRKLTVMEMAAKMNLSERQFNRIFKKNTGINMSEYLQNVRIQAAGQLLRTTDRKVSDIALSVGYQDLSYFHAIFRQKAGCTPRQYRHSSTRTRGSQLPENQPTLFFPQNG